jgi:hypothetical protein
MRIEGLDFGDAFPADFTAEERRVFGEIFLHAARKHGAALDAGKMGEATFEYEEAHPEHADVINPRLAVWFDFLDRWKFPGRK